MKMHRLTIFLSLFLIIFLSTQLRILPSYLPFTYSQARISSEDEVLREIKERIQKEYPELSLKLKEKLIYRSFKQAIKEKDFSLSVRKRIKELKNKFQDEDGINYLQEIDNYRWLRYIKNLLKSGHIGDRIIKGKQYDDYTLAPKGTYVIPCMGSIWVGYISHRIFSFFKKDSSIILTMSIIPIILVSIICLFSFSISYKFGGIFSGIFTCLSISLSPIFLQRSSFGWFDTDVYNLLFPSIILWFYLNLGEGESFKRRIIYILILSFLIGLYSFFWVGWWYIFDFVIGSIVFDGLLSFLIKREKKELNLLIFNLFFLFLFSFCYVSLFLKDFRVFFDSFLKPFSILTELKSPLLSEFWPNVYLTVAELRRSNIFEVINYVNGWFLFLFSLLGVIYLIIKGIIFKGEDERKAGIFLYIWILASLFASLKGIRFSLLLLLPVSICCGIAIGVIYGYLTQIFKKRFLKREIFFRLILLSFLSVPLGFFSFRAGVICRNIRPLMNDSWYRILNRIKQDTPRQTIINSWWDYGDWYKVVSERRVTFDAGSQNTPIAFWMARFFLTDSEDEAIGILRMLNNGSNQVFEELIKEGLDKFKAMEILNRIISVSKDEAKEILKEYLSEDRLNLILDLTHKIPEVTSLVILDSSLMGKIKALSYLGNWSHRKLNIWLNFKRLKREDFLRFLIERYNYSQKEAESIYNEIKLLDKKDFSNWISYTYEGYSNINKGEKEENLIFFDNSLVLNLSNKRARILGKGIPKSLYFIEKDQLNEIVYEDADLDFSCLVFQDEDGYKSIFLDQKLAKSIITRLFLLKGKTLKHFQLLYEEREDQNYIYVYKVIF